MPLRLDNQRIAIRERKLLEIMDLALIVIRALGLPLWICIAVGAAPMIALNAWLLGPMDQTALEYGDPPIGYLVKMMLLVVLEMPLATALATLYIGRSMFQEKPSARELAEQFLQSLPQLFLYQFVLRSLFIASGLLIFSWAIPFLVWPYMNEIVLLERNPLFSKKENRLSTFRRAQNLHSGARGELFVRWLGSTTVGALLVVSLWLSLWIVSSILRDHWGEPATALVIYLPVALWIVIGYLTVVRFLSYLDLRIRREGWEIELAQRAEARRLTRQPV